MVFRKTSKYLEQRVSSRMATTKRIFSRPRTKMYDSNFNWGESYYRSTLDNLDRKTYGSRPRDVVTLQETIEPPPAPRAQRPTSVPDYESVAKSAKVDDELDEEIMATLRKIRNARAAAAPSAEESFESAYQNRQDEVKKRFSERMLDTVGIVEVSDHDSALIRRRRLQREMDEAQQSAPIQWTKLSNDDALTTASARALRSRARLSDLEAEMDEMAERGAARERRAANLRAILSEEAAHNSSASLSYSAKKITTTTTTEKRSY